MPTQAPARYLVTVESLTEPGTRETFTTGGQEASDALARARDQLAERAKARALEALHREIRAYLATDSARDRIRSHYRRLRSAGLALWNDQRIPGAWPAGHAYRAARSHVALSYAEGTGACLFHWLTDGDYEPYDEDPEGLRQEIAKLRSGEWEALGCVLATPDNDHEASLWGIVIGSSQQDDEYRRDVETDLAYEAGILPAGIWHS